MYQLITNKLKSIYLLIDYPFVCYCDFIKSIGIILFNLKDGISIEFNDEV